MHAFSFQNFGNPRAFPPPPRKNWRALPQGHLRVRKLHRFVFQKYWQSFAYQKIAYILFPKCWQSPGPSPHPEKIWQALPRGLLRVKKLHALYFQLFWSPGPCTHPVKIWRALPRGYREGTCVSENCEHFFLQFLQSFGPSSERYRGGTCVSENCIHVVSKILAILQPFHPPRKNLASATAGAPACQKLHAFYFQLFCNPPALPPTP